MFLRMCNLCTFKLFYTDSRLKTPALVIFDENVHMKLEYSLIEKLSKSNKNGLIQFRIYSETRCGEYQKVWGKGIV